MWVCRLPVHIGPPGSRKFAVDFREKSVHSAGSMWASTPTVKYAGAYDFAVNFQIKVAFRAGEQSRPSLHPA